MSGFKIKYKDKMVFIFKDKYNKFNNRLKIQFHNS